MPMPLRHKEHCDTESAMTFLRPKEHEDWEEFSMRCVQRRRQEQRADEEGGKACKVFC